MRSKGNVTKRVDQTCKIPKKAVCRVNKNSVLLSDRNCQEVISDLSPEQAIEQAGLCLKLKECYACDVCQWICPDLCITRDEKTGDIVIDLDHCKGCGLCAHLCPKEAIHMVQESKPTSG